ncbi:efflux RND transporter periplasmic adaptor subunit [Brevifollis gellanilyticus]|uniref:RND transporter n=1 Tax=Brevifollis gellanilyticus TaxID=748831 RepID=A0A512M7E1_9BACT|nr:HlyD family efflux transporter periplasmic adaptor subunit [Brevifollis gellanilyticus]GEP42649.1 RND transporter [Brevifollis gellanilyticus]
MESTATPPWENTKKKPTRGLLRKLVLWGLGLGLVTLVASGLRTKPIPVETAKISRGPLTVHVVEEGKTRIRNRYIVAAPVTGNMRRVSLKAGDEVKANETVLTVIEPGISPLLDARAQAQAEARVQAAEAGQLRAQEAVAMARTSAQFATANWDRVKKNVAEGSISTTDRERIELEAQTRAREVRASEFAMKVAEYEVTTAKAALLQITAPGAGSGATMDVKSPVNGRVLKVQQESAMMVTAGTALVEVGDPADLEIEAEILSRDVVGMKPGAEVLVDQWGGDTALKARVRRVEPAAFTKVSALGVEEQRVIVLSDLEPLPPEAKGLGDRYRVEVRVAVWHQEDVLLVPGGGLFREGTEWMTFVKDGNHAKKVKVQVGRTDGKMSQVLGGIEAGAEVLMHPPDSVVDGAEIALKDVKVP